MNDQRRTVRSRGDGARSDTIHAFGRPPESRASSAHDDEKRCYIGPSRRKLCGPAVT